MDEGLSRAVRQGLRRACTKQGLIYRDKRLVNWDPKLLTAVSDIEVVQVESERPPLAFPLPPIVDADGLATGETHNVVATTRPETVLGDSGVAVHPEDGRYMHLVGKNVRLPLVGRLIPIVADAYSDPAKKGTGAVKITPAHMISTISRSAAGNRARRSSTSSMPKRDSPCRPTRRSSPALCRSTREARSTAACICTVSRGKRRAGGSSR